MIEVPNLNKVPEVATVKARLDELRAERGQLAKLIAERVKAPKEDAADALTSRGSGQAVPAESIDVLNERLRTYNRAIQKQQQIVADEIAKASQKIAKDLLPEHKVICADIAHALVALREALVAEREFRDALTQADVMYSASIQPMFIRNFNEGRIDTWLRLASEYGVAV